MSPRRPSPGPAGPGPAGPGPGDSRPAGPVPAGAASPRAASLRAVSSRAVLPCPAISAGCAVSADRSASPGGAASDGCAALSGLAAAAGDCIALRPGNSGTRGSWPARSISSPRPASRPPGQFSLAGAAAGRRYPAAPRDPLLAATVSSATHAKRDRECPGTDSAPAAGPDSPAPGAPGFPGPLAGHSRSQEEGDYRGHGAGRTRR